MIKPDPTILESESGRTFQLELVKQIKIMLPEAVTVKD